MSRGLFWSLMRAQGVRTATIASDAESNQTTPFNLFILFDSANPSFTNSGVTITGGSVGALSTNDNILFTGVVTPDVQTTQITIQVGDSNTLNISSAEQEYVDYLDEIPNVSGSVPNLAERVNVNAFVKYWKDLGIWAEIDRIWVLNTTGGRNTARINLKSPGTDTITENGTLSYSEGFISDDSTGYLATGFVPSTDGVNYQLNDASIIMYMRDGSTSTADTDFDIGTNVGALTAININRSNTSSRVTINSGSNTDIANTPVAGTYHIMRTASNRVALYRNGELVGTPATTASTSLPSGEFFIAALNNSGVGTSFTDRPYELVALGSNLESDASPVNFGVRNALHVDEDVNANINYVNSSIDGSVTNIYMRCFYKSKANQPLLILLAGWTQQATDFDDATYDRYRDYGFFTVGVSMRGRDGAGGTQDDSAREIYDIYDAIEFIKKRFAGLIDTKKVAVVGYSGGGGNTLGLISKFPDLVSTAVVFFPITDYGYDGTFGWWQQEPTRQATLEARIGGTPSAVPNEYKSRQHLVSVSNFTGKLFIYHDADDSTVEVNHSQRLAAQLTADGFTNYVYDETDSGDATRWLHSLPLAGQPVIQAEVLFKDDCLALETQLLPSSGTLGVNGFIKTKYFTCWLGNGTAAQDGKNRRATLTYNIVTNEYTIVPSIDSPETDMTVDFEDCFGRTYSATISTSTNFSAS